VRLEGLGQLKKINLIANRIRELTPSSTLLQPTTPLRAPAYYEGKVEKTIFKNSVSTFSKNPGEGYDVCLHSPLRRSYELFDQLSTTLSTVKLVTPLLDKFILGTRIQRPPEFSRPHFENYCN
jgi:hypothetical protein